MKLTHLLPIALLALAACQKEPDMVETQGTDAKPGLSVNAGELVLPAVKGRPGAAYFTLINSSDAVATVAAVAISGAGKAEMHETKDGTMSPLPALDIKPGETVKFERGGKHVMAFDLAESVVAGDEAEMTLTFMDGDKVSAPLKVQSVGAAADASSEHMH